MTTYNMSVTLDLNRLCWNKYVAVCNIGESIAIHINFVIFMIVNVNKLVTNACAPMYDIIRTKYISQHLDIVMYYMCTNTWEVYIDVEFSRIRDQNSEDVFERSTGNYCSSRLSLVVVDTGHPDLHQ